MLIVSYNFNHVTTAFFLGVMSIVVLLSSNSSSGSCVHSLALPAFGAPAVARLSSYSKIIIGRIIIGQSCVSFDTIDTTRAATPCADHEMIIVGGDEVRIRVILTVVNFSPADTLVAIYAPGCSRYRLFDCIAIVVIFLGNPSHCSIMETQQCVDVIRRFTILSYAH